MKIYKLEQCDLYGQTFNEKFFLKKEKGIDEFNKQVEHYKDDEHLPTAETLEEYDYDYAKEPIKVVTSHSDSVINRVMVTLWERCSHEYNEWDLYSRFVTLSEIEVE